MSYFTRPQSDPIHYCKFLYLLLILPISNCFAGGINISGTIKDVQGNFVQGAKVVFQNNISIYTASSNADGSYQIVIPTAGIDQLNTSDLRIASNYPNPFSDKTAIPVQINKQGTLLFLVYNLMGQKLREVSYHNLIPGEYYIEWDGTDQRGNHLTPGVYIYAVNFNGKQYTGKAIKSGNGQSYTGNSFPWSTANVLKSAFADSATIFLTDVSKNGYFRSTLNGMVVKHDTVINFTLAPFVNVPFKTLGNSLAYWNNTTYVPLFIKGVNLGSSPPGYWPGEIGYAISDDQYERWINRIGQMGFNTIRVYTLHPPVFYQKLANYNERHPDKPIYLFQGVWLEEVASRTASEYNLNNRTAGFEHGIEEVIKCIHGDLNIPQRLGQAYGNYKTDLSRWTIGFIIGREMSPQELDSTNKNNPAFTSYNGVKVSITGVTPSEAWITARVDKVIDFENSFYGIQRPVSFSSWPTLDPLKHPTEKNSDEDIASFDLNNINVSNAPAGYFASFHAYPYFPNFVNDDPGYQTYSDVNGTNPYLGYITDLRNHYTKIPLIIGEFGVPSSWGSAHQAISGMHHGGHSEEKQGEYDIRMLKNMYDAKLAGGIVFEWADEWFKPTWIVQYLETKSFWIGSAEILTRQLWLNLCSPEQNFGLIAFDPSDPLTLTPYQLDKTSGIVSDIKAASDDHFFHLEIDLLSNINTSYTLWVAFDTYRADLGESVLPNKTMVNNRAEFALQIPFATDTASLFVTQTYDTYGLTPRFLFADTVKQKFKSLPTDGAPWDLMRWKNDSALNMVQNIGKMVMKQTSLTDFQYSNQGVKWQQNKIDIRIPWTMLYVSDPTRMEVVNGFYTLDGGWNYTPVRAITDGIAISVVEGKKVVNTTNRYTWPSWLVVHPTMEREKASLKVIEPGLSGISDVPK